jgi:hypothetical protein
MIALHLGDEADAGFRGAIQNDLVEARECTAADEQDIPRVHLQEFLLRVLASALRRHRGDCPLDELQQRVIDGLSDLREILSISSI